MVAVSTWFRYIASKLDYSLAITRQAYTVAEIAHTQILDTIWKNLLQGKMTYITRNKGQEMAPIIGPHGGTLLVRKIPYPDPTRVHVGDVVVLRDPMDYNNRIVRRLAAIEGYEMASTDRTDDPFVLMENQCWVLADNKHLKPKEAYDSRTFGPVTMGHIFGRAIYCLRNAVDHGRVNNSFPSTYKDSPILEVELDVDEMFKIHDDKP